MPVNLIIGRNNSGKSTLLDVLQYLTRPDDLASLGHRGANPSIELTATVSEEELRKVFQENASYGEIDGNHWEFGKRWVGAQITWAVRPDDKNVFHRIDPEFGIELPRHESQLARVKGNPFATYAFKRLRADRDISPEPESDATIIDPNGRGATNTIQNFVNQRHLPSGLVEETLLGELNKIFEPDSSFTDIVVQKTGSIWEIFLEEDQKGRVALSHTGSGLKTVILVLLFLHVVPWTENRALNQYLFGFEELENNLHPALQRRLLLYLREFAVEHGCRFFLTTHSNVAIDIFANDPQAQILHVIHDRASASIRSVRTWVDNCGVLDDLDIRASDLLQSNGIVWVEGPSDRLYFNRWISLWSDETLKEGAHYQCVFYGGRLLAHLSADQDSLSAVDATRILRVNRNAILIMDSDRRAKASRLNETKRRLLDEVGRMNGLA